MGDFGAFSFMGELGERNFRGSGTYGVYLAPCQRLKVSGEYLTQNLEYEFGAGDKRGWVAQYALGGAYQYLFSSSIFQSIDLGGSYSHAFNKHLSPSPTGTPRRIAGSDGGFGYLGSTVRLWSCGYLSATVNYDHVAYHRHYLSRKEANGWGGTVELVQMLPRDFSFNLGAEFRPPFNFFEGEINWNPRYADWGLNLGLYGNYTDGKEGVPNVIAGGFKIGFSFGPTGRTCCRATSENLTPSQDCYSRMFCDLFNWVSEPAVYMPVVLAVPDAISCALPGSSPIPDLMVMGRATSFDVSPYFTGDGLVYSASGPLVFPEFDFNTATGAGIVGNLEDEMTYVMTITATNSCGSVSQPFAIVMSGPP
jgi:hypothetical protein